MQASFSLLEVKEGLGERFLLNKEKRMLLLISSSSAWCAQTDMVLNLLVLHGDFIAVMENYYC